MLDLVDELGKVVIIFALQFIILESFQDLGQPVFDSLDYPCVDVG